MKEQFETSVFGNNLIYKKNYTKEFIQSTIKKNNLNGLKIMTSLKEDRLENLFFLNDYDFLESLDITSSSDFDLTFLKKLKSLRYLSIAISGKNIIDLSNLNQLIDLSITWRKGKILGLEKCQNIKSLCLIEFKENDLTIINPLKNLNDLKIATGSIKSAKGVEGLPLEKIIFGYCRSLESISSINNNIYLKELNITSSSKIKDYDSLNNLPNLESLDLINNKEIPSIKFINNLPSLKRLSILENTTVGDGDMLPAKDIKELYYKHMKHYNYKIVNEIAENKMKKNLEKLRGFFKIIKK
jgi:hypothetical protein